MAKDIDEIRQIFAKAKTDVSNDSVLKDAFSKRFYQTLASHPYNLAPEDMDAAYHDSVNLNPQCPYYCLAGTVGRSR